MYICVCVCVCVYILLPIDKKTLYNFKKLIFVK